MTKKKEDKKDFDMESSLKQVNPFLRDGFILFIQDKQIATEKQFDKYYKEYKELK